MNYPDGFDDRCLEPEISDEVYDEAIEKVVNDIAEAGPDQLDDLRRGCFGLLDDVAVVDEVRAIFREHPQNPRGWILEALQESAASGGLDVTAVERYFTD